VAVNRQTLVAALLRERHGYVLRGLEGRVAAVDAVLRSLGVKPDRETATPSKRPGRSTASDVETR
jgi:hypothetical protein